MARKREIDRALKRTNKEFTNIKNNSIPASISVDVLNEAYNNMDKSIPNLLAFIQTHKEKCGYKSDAQLAAKANITPQTLSKIILRKTYTSRSNLLAIAFALHLTLEETIIFLKEFKYTLNINGRLDYILMAFLEQKFYNVYKINEVLEENKDCFSSYFFLLGQSEDSY